MLMPFTVYRTKYHFASCIYVDIKSSHSYTHVQTIATVIGFVVVVVVVVVFVVVVVVVSFTVVLFCVCTPIYTHTHTHTQCQYVYMNMRCRCCCNLFDSIIRAKFERPSKFVVLLFSALFPFYIYVGMV